MTRKITSSLIILVLIAFPAAGNALEVGTGDNFKAKLLGLHSAGLTPHSPIYGLDLFFEKLRPVFSFSHSKRASLYINFTLEKISEVIISVEQYADDKSDKRAKVHIQRSNKAINEYLSKSGHIIENVLDENPSTSNIGLFTNLARNILHFKTEMLEAFDNNIYNLEQQQERANRAAEYEDSLNKLQNKKSFLNQARSSILTDINKRTRWIERLY